MNHSNELYVVYTCNRTEMRSLLDNIVKCLPSLTTTVQGEAANGKMLHYDETSETRSLGTFIHNNLPNNVDVFLRHHMERGEIKHKPVAACVEGTSWVRVEANEVAILTPLSKQSVNIMLWKWKTEEGEIQERTRTIIKNADSSYLVLPGGEFRVLPQGVPFHLAVVPIKILEE